MTKEEVHNKLSKLVSDVVAVGLQHGLTGTQIRESHRYLIDQAIEDLEIPYEYECDICEDTGETTEMETVYAGEPHVAPIGSRTCICRIHEDEDDGDDRQED